MIKQLQSKQPIQPCMCDARIKLYLVKIEFGILSFWETVNVNSWQSTTFTKVESMEKSLKGICIREQAYILYDHWIANTC